MSVLEGLPTLQFTDHISTPPLIDLLRSPQTYRASLDDLYKHSPQHYRELFDQIPLKNDKKHVIVQIYTTFLKEGYCPVSTTDWHCDGNGNSMESDDRHHIYIGEYGNITTEFLTNPINVDVARFGDPYKLEHMVLRKWLEENQQALGFNPLHVDKGRFTTFTSRHPHRIGLAEKPEFRFFINVRESDSHVPLVWEKARIHQGKVYQGNYGKEIVSIEQDPKWGIIIRDRY